MDIELDGKCVIHKTFGKGLVLTFDGSYLEVDFEEAGKKCKFQFPSCFYGYLKLEDDEMQRIIEPVVDHWKEENEIDRKEELKLKHQKTMQAIEERRQAAERKRLRGAQRNVEHRFIQSTNSSKEKDKKDG